QSVRLQRLVGSPELHRAGGDLFDPAAGADRLVIQGVAGLGLIGFGPFRVEGRGESGARTRDVSGDRNAGRRDDGGRRDRGDECLHHILLLERAPRAGRSLSCACDDASLLPDTRPARRSRATGRLEFYLSEQSDLVIRPLGDAADRAVAGREQAILHLVALVDQGDEVKNGLLSTGNGTIGGIAKGTYDEVGLFTQVKF